MGIQGTEEDIELTPPGKVKKKGPSAVRDFAFQQRREHSLKRGRRRPPEKPRKTIGGPPMLHKLDVLDSEGKSLTLDTNNFPGTKIFLIVNIASACGFTSHLAGLEKVYKEYKNIGLQVVAFPSNSFNQEPLDNDEIQSFVKEKYDVTFPVMAKCDVNGEDELGLFTWLKVAAIQKSVKAPSWAPREKTGLGEKDVQWNFEKFLVYKVGGKERVLRFAHDVTPEDLVDNIEYAFSQGAGMKDEL